MQIIWHSLTVSIFLIAIKRKYIYIWIASNTDAIFQ